MQNMTDRKGFLAAAATAAGATGVIAGQQPAIASPSFSRVKFVILRAGTPDEVQDIEWHINHNFSIVGFAMDSSNTGWLCLVNLQG